MYHTVWQLKGEWYAWSWPHPPPSLHGTWGSNYKLEWFVTRLIYSQQQEVVKQSFHLQLLFNNITREKWQFVGMTQYGRKAGSILHCYPEESPSHLSASRTYTNMKQNGTSCALLPQHQEQHPAVPSFLPALFPAIPLCHFRLQAPANYNTNSPNDVCNQTALTLLCTCVFFPNHYWPSRSLENQPTNPTPNGILKSSYLIERVSKFRIYDMPQCCCRITTDNFLSEKSIPCDHQPWEKKYRMHMSFMQFG